MLKKYFMHSWWTLKRKRMDDKMPAENYAPIDQDWLEKAGNLWTTPWADTPSERVIVDPIILSHAATMFKKSPGYFYQSPTELLNAYAHKMHMDGLTGGELHDVEYDDESDWVCQKCGETALERNVDMSYMGVTRAGPAIVCPKCQEFHVSDGVAKTLKTAESILEEKRA